MESDISLQSIAVIDTDHLHAEIEDETVVLHPDNRTYYSLNPVAARIWELLQEPRRIQDIRDQIVAEYDVSRAQCEDDLFEFLELLFAEDFVEFQQP